MAEGQKDEVLAVKRVGWQTRGGSLGRGSKPSARTTLKVPSGRTVDVIVVSDGYIGLEYRVEGVEIPSPPIVDGVDKEKIES